MKIQFKKLLQERNVLPYRNHPEQKETGIINRRIDVESRSIRLFLLALVEIGQSCSFPNSSRKSSEKGATETPIVSKNTGEQNPKVYGETIQIEQL